MGYVDTAYTKPGTEIFIKIRDKAVKASVAKIPFYQN